MNNFKIPRIVCPRCGKVIIAATVTAHDHIVHEISKGKYKVICPKMKFG